MKGGVHERLSHAGKGLTGLHFLSLYTFNLPIYRAEQKM